MLPHYSYFYSYFILLNNLIYKTYHLIMFFFSSYFFKRITKWFKASGVKLVEIKLKIIYISVKLFYYHKQTHIMIFENILAENLFCSILLLWNIILLVLLLCWSWKHHHVLLYFFFASKSKLIILLYIYVVAECRFARYWMSKSQRLVIT